MLAQCLAMATLLVDRRVIYEDGSFTEFLIWSVPAPVRPSRHRYKYSLAYVVNGERVIGYDNERGKGDHRHMRDAEAPYLFRSMRQLVADFTADVERIRQQIDADKAKP